jgi:dihydropteroate synthase
LLAGLSRKGFLRRASQQEDQPQAEPMRALQDATTAANTAAILAGAHILRVHDVGTARDAAALADRILAAVAISTQPPKPLS